MGKVTHAFGAQMEFDYRPGHPSLSNDPGCAEAARRAVVEVLGEQGVGSYRGTLAGELRRRGLAALSGETAS